MLFRRYLWFSTFSCVLGLMNGIIQTSNRICLTMLSICLCLCLWVCLCLCLFRIRENFGEWWLQSTRAGSHGRPMLGQYTLLWAGRDRLFLLFSYTIHISKVFFVIKSENKTCNLCRKIVWMKFGCGDGNFLGSVKDPLYWPPLVPAVALHWFEASLSHLTTC